VRIILRRRVRNLVDEPNSLVAVEKCAGNTHGSPDITQKGGAAGSVSEFEARSRELSRAEAGRWDWDRVAEQYERIFESIVQ